MIHNDYNFLITVKNNTDTEYILNVNNDCNISVNVEDFNSIFNIIKGKVTFKNITADDNIPVSVYVNQAAILYMITDYLDENSKEAAIVSKMLGENISNICARFKIHTEAAHILIKFRVNIIKALLKI